MTPALLLSLFSFLIAGMYMLFLPPLPKETLIPIVSRNISSSQEKPMSNTAKYSACGGQISNPQAHPILNSSVDLSPLFIPIKPLCSF